MENMEQGTITCSFSKVNYLKNRFEYRLNVFYQFNMIFIINNFDICMT